MAELNMTESSQKKKFMTMSLHHRPKHCVRWRRWNQKRKRASMQCIKPDMNMTW